MTIGCRVVILLLVCSAALRPAFAQNAVIITDHTVQLAGIWILHVPKHKRVNHVNGTKTSHVEKSLPRTIPMDFSGMAKRYVDLKPEFDSTADDDVRPSMGPSFLSTGDGGIIPGFSFRF